MSELKKILEGVNVEWRAIDDYIAYLQPTKYLIKSKNYNNDFETPVLTAGKTFILGYTDEIDGIYKAKIKPVIIFDDFTTANKWVDFDFKAKSSAMKILVVKDENKISLKYFFYLLNSLPSELVAGDHKRQWISNYANKLIPIPCPDNPEKSLKIQQEIVRILDRLSEETNQLTAALQKELQLHQKRYDFYREELFKFEGKEVEWKALVELAEIGTGSRNTNQAVVDGKYPFFVRSQIPRRINEFEFDETAIITAGDGVGVGKVFHFVNEKYALHQRAYRIVIKNNKLSPKFLFYYIKNNFSKYVEKNSVYASVTSLRKPMFEKYPVPVPSLKEQERIIQIIDEFDLTTNFIIKEIQKEITLRNKQYEYYRDHLLSFQSLHAEAEAIQ